MKFVKFCIKDKISYGIIEGDKVVEVSGDIFGSFSRKNVKYNLFDVKFLAPCQPQKIVCVGLNYTDHARELNFPVPKTPILFIKPASSVLGPEEEIVYPAMSEQVDYEAELAVVIKTKAKNIEKDEVQKYILGYTCFNDVTARDLQKEDVQWTRAKSFDTFSPVGPCIVTGIKTDKLKVEAYLNDKLKQSGTTDNMIFKPDELVSFISKVMTLMPGDIIATGTPVGVGPMNAGDIVEIRIKEIGNLRNYVVKKKEPGKLDMAEVPGRTE